MALSVTDSEALYVYAVTAGEAVVEEPGVEDGTVQGLSVGPFHVVVSVVARADWTGDAADEHMADLAWVAPRAQRHEAVVEAVMDAAGAVYPARFGTLYSGVEPLRNTLTAHRGALERFFSAVEGAEEWAVKGLLDRERAREHVAGARPAEAESGTAYLKQRQQMADATDRVEDWLDDVAATLLDEMEAYATQYRVLEVQGNAGREAEVVFNWALLVPTGQVDAFRTAVERATDRYADHGLSLDCTGPWPPYSFRPSLEPDAPEA